MVDTRVTIVRASEAWVLRKGDMVILLVMVLAAVVLFQCASAEGTEDTSPPTFVEDRSDTNGTSSTPILFEVVVFDETGVGGVDLLYWHGSLIIWPRVYLVEMVPLDVDGSGNGVYATDDVWITWLNDTTMDYQFRAFDLAGNEGRSEVGTVGVWDDTPPALVEDLSDRPPTQGRMSPSRSPSQTTSASSGSLSGRTSGPLRRGSPWLLVGTPRATQTGPSPT